MRPREQGAWPKVRKGAGSKENIIWEQGAQKFGIGSMGAGSSEKLGNGARSKRNCQGAKGKIKKEQGAKRTWKRSSENW